VPPHAARDIYNKNDLVTERNRTHLLGRNEEYLRRNKARQFLYRLGATRSLRKDHGGRTVEIRLLCLHDRFGSQADQVVMMQLCRSDVELDHMKLKKSQVGWTGEAIYRRARVWRHGRERRAYSHPSLNASPQNAYPLLMHSIFRDGHRLSHKYILSFLILHTSGPNYAGRWEPKIP